jgi:ABC-type transport system involved in cytochrome bd biosynthesis fused ATPase/permease subunit
LGEKSCRKRKVSQLLKLDLPRFAYGSRTIDEIMKLIERGVNTDSKFFNIRNQQNMLSSLMTQLCIAVIILLPFGNLTGMLAVTMQFTSTVNNLFSLLNNNTHFEKLFASMRKDFENAKKQKSEIGRAYLNKKITVESYGLEKEDFSLKLSKAFTYGIGNVIGIFGASGSGKSTFIKGIFVGDDDAKVTLSTGEQPKNFFHHVSWFYQNSKQNLHVNKLSLSEVFDNCRDEKLIDRCLRITKVGKPIERLKKKAKKYQRNQNQTQSQNLGLILSYQTLVK